MLKENAIIVKQLILDVDFRAECALIILKPYGERSLFNVGMESMSSSCSRAKDFSGPGSIFKVLYTPVHFPEPWLGA